MSEIRDDLQNLKDGISYCRLTTPDGDNESAVADAHSILDDIIKQIDEVESLNNEVRDASDRIRTIVY